MPRFASRAVVLALLLAATIVGATAASALANADVYRKKQAVWLLVPKSALTNEKTSTSIWNGSQTLETAVHIEQLNGELAVAGRTDWQLGGFPILARLEFDKQKDRDDKKLWSGKKYKEYEFKADGFKLRVRVAPSVTDKDAAVRAIFADSEQAKSAYLADVYKALGNAAFTGELASVGPEARQLLLAFAHVTASGTTVRTEQFRDEAYLVVDLDRDTTVYNELQLDEAARVAYVLNERLLTLLKAFHGAVADAPAVAGIKLELDIPHRSFLEDGDDFELDELQLYSTSTGIAAFVNYDITSQELVDRSFLIVDGNRIQVTLSS